MPIENYLIDGETILAQAGTLYASNKRLLRYQKRYKGEELDDIPYSHITSIGVVRNTRRSLVKAGVVLAIIGLATLVTVLAVRPALKSVSDLLGNATGSLPVPGIPLIGLDLVSLVAPLIPFSAVVLAIGIVMIALGVILRECFVQFRAPGLEKNTETKFRLSGVSNEASMNLVRTVRQQSLARESDSVKAQPAEDRRNKAPDQGS